jgi:hypothetical protein
LELSDIPPLIGSCYLLTVPFATLFYRVYDAISMPLYFRTSKKIRPEKLALEGSIVMIDAMGCRHKIVGQMVQQKADYLFSLKKNSNLPSAETRYEDVQEYFKDPDFSIPAGKNPGHIH